MAASTIHPALLRAAEEKLLELHQSLFAAEQALRCIRRFVGGGFCDFDSLSADTDLAAYSGNNTCSLSAEQSCQS